MTKFVLKVVISFLLTLTRAQIYGYDVKEMQMKQEPGKWFGWDNCDKNAAFDVTALSITPDPVKPNSNIYLSFTANAKQDIPSKSELLQADIKATIKTTQGMVIDICDFVPETYCQPKDVCSMLKQMKKCPQAIDKLVPHCQCPLKKNVYKVDNASFPLPPIPLQGLLTVHMNVTQKQQPIACLDLRMCIGSCS